MLEIVNLVVVQLFDSFRSRHVSAFEELFSRIGPKAWLLVPRKNPEGLKKEE